MERYILTLTCQDTSGIIHAIAGGLLDVQANVLEQAQFTDEPLNQFCLRTRFESPERDAAVVRSAVEGATGRFNPAFTLRREADRRRIIIMVSQQDHCLVDLLYRYGIGELPVEIPLIVSNHPDCRDIAERHGIEFLHLPVTPDTKEAQERRLLECVEKHQVDFVVLARYMQILSDDLCGQLSGRVVNIHHSFLPGFKGARPYHQAHERGVKLIGATAHFVTADLDEGPIIEQGVERVNHADSPEALAEIGRDIERVVLARAVRLLADDRIIRTGSRTVVFD
jgi:formyltetrahydrofolate deformylase